MKMISSAKIKDCIKSSHFRFEDVASGLGISRRTLFRRLENNSLTIENLNVLLKILNVDIKKFEE